MKSCVELMIHLVGIFGLDKGISYGILHSKVGYTVTSYLLIDYTTWWLEVQNASWWNLFSWNMVTSNNGCYVANDDNGFSIGDE